MVVEAKVLDEVTPERGELGHQALGEGRTPALLQDGALDPLDAAVGLRPTGADDALHQAAAMLGRGVERRDMQLGPGEAGAHIDRGVLPDPALRAAESADMKAVQLHQRARTRCHQMRRFAGHRPLRLGWRGVAGDERQTLAPRGDAVARQDLEHARARDDQAAPCRAAQLRGDTPWTQAGLAQGEGDDSLLEEGRELVGHARRTALTRPQDLQTVTLHEGSPAVIARAVIAELAAGPTNADVPGAREQTQTVTEEQIIIGHGSGPPLVGETPKGWAAFVCSGLAPNCRVDLWAVQASGRARWRQPRSRGRQ